MPVPEFILSLREKIGHDMLWLPGVSAVVLDGQGRVLLCQRSDNSQWTVITGILDPGEEPAPGALREVLEETGVVAEAEQLMNVGAVGPIRFPNGDCCQFLNLDFRCRYVSGEARVNDDESIAVSWFGPEELPPLNARHRMLIDRAMNPLPAATFEH